MQDLQVAQLEFIFDALCVLIVKGQATPPEVLWHGLKHEVGSSFGPSIFDAARNVKSVPRLGNINVCKVEIAGTTPWSTFSGISMVIIVFIFMVKLL